MATDPAEPHDIHHMRAALALARRGLGDAWPNPAVGCVLVRGHTVVGRGWTRPGGRPHAEAEALARAGAGASGATAFVTLEPCAHHGRGPPCAPALAEAGVSRVVVACRDPDPRVAGKGVATLREAGVDVVEGIVASAARALNAGFFSRVRRGRPLVTLKVASSLDGRIATRTGESRWITGPEARAAAHVLRARHDAVAVGSGTALADDPQLTCRPPVRAVRAPVRVVFDRRLRTPLTHRLVAGARDVPTWIVAGAGVDPGRVDAYRKRGVEVILPAGATASPEAGAALAALATRGITRLLVEGGRGLATALLRAGLVDRLVWFRAPSWIGGDGVPAAGPLGVSALPEAPRFLRRAAATVGGDLVETYESE